jgi:hypothetical protein
MQQAAVECADPEVGVVAGERGHVHVGQGSVKGREVLTVVNQQTMLVGAQQNAASGERQHRGDGAVARVLGQKLAEAAAVEGQQALAAGSEEELGVVGVGGHAGRQVRHRRGGKLEAYAVLAAQLARAVVLEEACGAGEVEAAAVLGSVGEGGGRAQVLDLGGRFAIEAGESERDLALGGDLLLGLGEGAVGLPESEASKRYARDREHHRRQAPRSLK